MLTKNWIPIYPLVLLWELYKGFLSRALSICSKKYLDKETELLIKVFGKKRNSIKVLEKVFKEYTNDITCVKEKGSVEKPENEKTAKIPWVPILGPKLIKEYKKLVWKLSLLGDVI